VSPIPAMLRIDFHNGASVRWRFSDTRPCCAWMGSSCSARASAHGGRVIDTAGDVPAEIGSVVNAVECAVAMQKAIGLCPALPTAADRIR
jgi:hypothetical protein